MFIVRCCLCKCIMLHLCMILTAYCLNVRVFDPPLRYAAVVVGFLWPLAPSRCFVALCLKFFFFASFWSMFVAHLYFTCSAVARESCYNAFSLRPSSSNQCYVIVLFASLCIMLLSRNASCLSFLLLFDRTGV